MPLSGRKIAKLFERAGFREIKGGGKGSHMKLRKGQTTVIIPGHKELATGLEKALLKLLGKHK